MPCRAVVAPVRNRRDLSALVAFPCALHRGERLWTGPPRRDVRAMLWREKNPFFEHAAAEYFLAHNAATAVAPAMLPQKLLDHAAAWGTAFPSSHVAAALAASVSAWQGWRALGACLLPLAALLSLGTVYGQFYYGVDALAGAVLAVLVLALHPPRPAD